MATYINHVAYSWSMIQLKIANSESVTDTGGEAGILIDCTAVNYDTNRKSENIYGLGGQPRSRGFGNVTYTGNIEHTLPRYFFAASLITVLSLVWVILTLSSLSATTLLRT